VRDRYANSIGTVLLLLLLLLLVVVRRRVAQYGIGYWLDDQGVIPNRDKHFSLLHHVPTMLWAYPIFQGAPI
jgi:hypothetical protein